MSDKLKSKKEKNDQTKVEDELSAMRQASAQDILKDLGPMSKEEYEYYRNL